MGAAQGLLQPPTPPSYTAESLPIIWIPCETTKTKIPAIFYEHNEAHFTILYSGRNNEDLGQCNQDLLVLKETLRVNIIAFDYCGFGLHEAKEKISEQTFCGNIESVFMWLVNVKHVPSSKIIAMGKGIGTGPVISLCSSIYYHGKLRTTPGSAWKKKIKKSFKKIESPDLMLTDSTIPGNNEIAACVLISPMASALSLLPQGASSPEKSKDVFNNIKKMIYIECPVVIVHGINDQIIPLEHAQKLKQCVANLWRCLELEDVGHYGVDNNDDFIDSMIALMKELAPSTEQNLQTSLIPKPIPSMYIAPEAIIKEWLRPLGLDHYSQQFIMRGYIDMFSVLTLDEFELTSIGIASPEEQQKILNDIENRRLFLPIEPYIVPWEQLELRDIIRRSYYSETYVSIFHGEKVSVTRYYPEKMTPQRFVVQALKLLQCNHPNVLKPVHAVLEDEHLALVFPWMHNGSLLDELNSSKKVNRNASQKLSICRSIASALNYLHNQDPPFYHLRLSSRHIYFNASFDNVLVGGLSQLALEEEDEGSLLIPFERLPSRSDKVDIYNFAYIVCEIGNTHCVSESKMSTSEFIKNILNETNIKKDHSRRSNKQHDIEDSQELNSNSESTESEDSLLDDENHQIEQNGRTFSWFKEKIKPIVIKCFDLPQKRISFEQILHIIDELIKELKETKQVNKHAKTAHAKSQKRLARRLSLGNSLSPDEMELIEKLKEESIAIENHNTLPKHIKANLSKSLVNLYEPKNNDKGKRVAASPRTTKAKSQKYSKKTEKEIYKKTKLMEKELGLRKNESPTEVVSKITKRPDSYSEKKERPEHDKIKKKYSDQLKKENILKESHDKNKSPMDRKKKSLSTDRKDKIDFTKESAKEEDTEKIDSPKIRREKKDSKDELKKTSKKKEMI